MEKTLDVKVDKDAGTAEVKMRLSDTVVVSATIPVSDVQTFIATFQDQMES